MQNATASNVMAHDNDAQSWRQDAEEEFAEIEQSKRMIRKYTGKININKIIERLPLKYREQQPHRENMEKVLKTLKLHPHGSNMPDLVSESGTQKHKCTDCLNALVHSKDVIKVTQQGSLVLYQLDPVKYPSALVAV
ncbi:hypothetical protein BC937DRAFT_94351 [Endogone sp. FLAS-F59071]|nr:hypothetical protein BC937DRAFT_94351 [Endogone sp. FLAS-F59071]|eukprot:RUS20803.1 hypothetical protein BC937DRAFT_94351 [Endogone sp. FLAS-F59071]